MKEIIQLGEKAAHPYRMPIHGKWQMEWLKRFVSLVLWSDELFNSLIKAERDAAIKAERERFKKIAENVLGWVYAGDRDKPFTDADFVGEMVRIRLTGLTELAEIVKPGCREAARSALVERFNAMPQIDLEAEVRADIDRQLNDRVNADIANHLQSLSDVHQELGALQYKEGMAPPNEIVEAAQKLTDWAAMHNIRNWKICGVQNRVGA